MHLQRWISGLILAPGLILLIVFSPPWLFLLFILLVIFLALREYFALILPEVSPGERGAGFILGFLLAASLYSRDPRCFLFTIFLAFFFLSIRSLFRPEEFSARVEKGSKQLLGFFYLPFLLGHFVLMRNLERGRLWVLFTLVAVYFGDTLAFYVGRAWGKRKMAPQISPGKTVEGGLGAVTGSMAGAWVSKMIFFPSIPLPHALILGAAVGVIGQLGDLWESLLKRSAQVKDSGVLIPGHGGLLDRIDSVLFAAPLVYYYAWGMGIG
jgi:phosphatidate cytidylyltransferase